MPETGTAGCFSAAEVLLWCYRQRHMKPPYKTLWRHFVVLCRQCVTHKEPKSLLGHDRRWCPPTLANSGEDGQFWRMARSGCRLRLKRGSTVGALERSSRARVVVRDGAGNEPSIFMDHFLVHSIASVE